MEQCFKNFNNFATRIYVKLISWSLILFLIQPIILISREEEKKKRKKNKKKENEMTPKVSPRSILEFDSKSSKEGNIPS